MTLRHYDVRLLRVFGAMQNPQILSYYLVIMYLEQVGKGSFSLLQKERFNSGHGCYQVLCFCFCFCFGSSRNQTQVLMQARLNYTLIIYLYGICLIDMSLDCRVLGFHEIVVSERNIPASMCFRSYLAREEFSSLQHPPFCKDTVQTHKKIYLSLLLRLVVWLPCIRADRF